MFASLLPKTAPFFEMLMEQNAMLRRATEMNLELFTSPEGRVECNARISTQENEADDMYRRIMRALSATFITPIDREDILRIAQETEECLDRIQRVSIRLTAFSMPAVLFPARRVAEILVEMCGLTTAMLEGLPKRHDAHRTRAFRTLREECDSLLAIGLAEVMEDSGDSARTQVMVLKWIQIYESLEFVIRQFTELFEHIEEAVMKNV